MRKKLSIIFELLSSQGRFFIGNHSEMLSLAKSTLSQCFKDIMNIGLHQSKLELLIIHFYLNNDNLRKIQPLLRKH